MRDALLWSGLLTHGAFGFVLCRREKRISQLEREVAILKSEPHDAHPPLATSLSSSFSASSPQRILSLDTQGIFGGSNLLDSTAGMRARDELTSQRDRQMSHSIEKLTEFGLLNAGQHGLFTRDVTYDDVRGEKGAKQMMESVEVGEFDRSDPHGNSTVAEKYDGKCMSQLTHALYYFWSVEIQLM